MSTAVPLEPTQRKGWCPGALRPMQTGDGLLVRVKPSLNRLSCAITRELANLSARYGNGVLDLSQRANLQFRGVTDNTFPDLIDALSELGLLDEDVATESVRNILVSPLAGIDPGAADVSTIVSKLEAALRTNRALHALPGKFSFAIDAGGHFPLGPTASDITLTAVPNKDLWDLHHAGAELAVARVDQEGAVEAIVKLSEFFLSNQSDKVRRMRDLSPSTPHQSNANTTRSNAIGKISLGDTRPVAAIGCPFGRISAGQLGELAKAAQNAGCASLHLTPWRSIFIPCNTSDHIAAILDVAKTSGLVTEANDQRLALDACPGQPACTNGETHTMADAETLSQKLDFSDIALTPGLIHVSGCTKGCARRQASSITLVGRDGSYDLIIDGTTADTPNQTGIAEADLVSTVQHALDSHAHKNRSTKGAGSIG